MKYYSTLFFLGCNLLHTCTYASDNMKWNECINYIEYITPSAPVVALGFNIDTIIYIALHTVLSPIFVWTFIKYIAWIDYKIGIFVDFLWIFRYINILYKRQNSVKKIKNVLITGGSNGLGLEIVKYLQNECDKVLIVDNSEIDNKELKGFKNIKFYKLDLNNDLDLNEIFRLIKIHEVDLLICNAGIRQFNIFNKLSDDNIDKIIKVNFTSHCKIIKEFINCGNEENCNKKKIVLIGSILGFVGPKKLGIYSATKNAFLSISDSVRIEHPNINIISIISGQLNTKMFQDVTVNSFLGPVIQINKLAYKIIKHVKCGENDDFMYPFYSKILPVYRILPYSVKSLLRWFSDMDNV